MSELSASIAALTGVAEVTVTRVRGEDEDLLVQFCDPRTDDAIIWHLEAAREARVLFLEMRADLDDDTALRLVAAIAAGRYEAVADGRAVAIFVDGERTVIA